MATKKYLIVCGGSGAYLLGQMDVLGINGEIQLDVESEILATRKRLVRKTDTDTSKSVCVDKSAENVSELLTKIDGIASREKWTEKDKKHAEFLQKYNTHDTLLSKGLGQVPIYGGLAILVKEVKDAFILALNQLLEKTAKGQQYSIEYWVVSSTAGGTGEGIHRAVNEIITQVANQRTDAGTAIKNIRIGQSTYQEISGNDGEIHTMFGILADSKLRDTLLKKYKSKVPTISWYYIDLPDYGPGEETKELRGNKIALAAKAVMLPELTENLNKLEANSNTLLIRTGYWARDYDPAELYYSTLMELRSKLQFLIDPASTIVLERCEKPIFIGEGSLIGLSNLIDEPGWLENKIDKEGWEIPSQDRPSKIDDIKAYISTIINSIEELVGKGNFNYLSIQPKPHFERKLKNSAEPPAEFTTRDKFENTNWYSDYKNAQMVFIWAKKLLGIPYFSDFRKNIDMFFEDWKKGDINNGLINELFSTYDICRKVFKFKSLKNGSNQARKLRSQLIKLGELTHQCKILYDLMISARNAIVGFNGPKNVMDYTDSMIKIQQQLGNTHQSSSVTAAELYDVLDHLENKSWYELLLEPVTKQNSDDFEKNVKKGAIGLTKSGLLELLNLDASSTTAEMIKKLQDNFGEMLVKGQPQDAHWMNSQDPPQEQIVDSYNYRLLPKLQENFKIEFTDEINRQTENNMNGEKISCSFVFPSIGVLGLSILAFHSVAIAKREDAFKTPTFLIHPFVKKVKTMLSEENWIEHTKGETTSKYTIATASTIGDDLPWEVLHKAGFDDDEINKIAEFYTVSKL